MNALSAILSVVIFLGVLGSNFIALRFLSKEPVKSFPNISAWILNCALANFLHCLFILPVGIGVYALESQDLLIVEDFWMQTETPFSIQFHAVALLFVIFFDYVKIRNLSTKKTHVLLFLSVLVVSLCFMLPQVILASTSRGDLMNVTQTPGERFSVDPSDSLEDYMLLCTMVTSILLPALLIIVCHPFTKQNFQSLQQDRTNKNLQDSETNLHSSFIQKKEENSAFIQRNEDHFSHVNDHDSNEIELEYIETKCNTTKHQGTNTEQNDNALDAKLKQFHEMQKRLRHCGMMTSSLEGSEDESDEDNSDYDESVETETSSSMLRKYYINAAIHFLFWLPWVTAKFINWNCPFCIVSKSSMFLVSLVPCAGMIFSPAAIFMTNFLGKCT